MRKRPLLLFGSVVVMINSCGGNATLIKSRFLSSYSAPDIIRRSYDRPDVKEQPKVESGGTSSAMGGQGVHHSYDSAELSISKSEEPVFLARVKREIEEQLEKSGGHKVGEGSGAGNYAIQYSDGNVNGWIDIVGMRGAGDSYKLVIIITEK